MTIPTTTATTQRKLPERVVLRLADLMHRQVIDSFRIEGIAVSDQSNITADQFLAVAGARLA